MKKNCILILRTSIFLLSILVFGLHSSFGQFEEFIVKEPKSKIRRDGHRYPAFDPGSNFSQFEIHFPITEKNEISLGGIHFRTYFADRFTLPVQFKQYFSEKSYLLGGYQWEWDLRNGNSGKPNPIPLQEAFFGVGHDVKPGMFMEAKYVQPIGKSDFNKVGFDKGAPRLEWGGKWKF